MRGGDPLGVVNDDRLVLDRLPPEPGYGKVRTMSMELSFRIVSDHDAVRLFVSGEVDFGTASSLRAAIEEAGETDLPAVIVDFGGVIFIESCRRDRLRTPAAGRPSAVLHRRVVDTRASTGAAFGVPRLADLLVRAALEKVPPEETVRRLAASVNTYNGAGLSDDATLLLLTYHGAPQQI